MDDDAKRTPAPEPEPVLGTVQMPRGAKLEVGPPPVMPTQVPAPGAAVAAGPPPAMPDDEWRYTIGSEIARGGMGRVVEATDTVLGRTVALKEALARDPEAIRRFERETRITARLEHPSIVPIHDAGTSPAGSPFYVMRKISGRPLEELVGRQTELADRLALVPHIVAASHAVAHAHERGIVHRDIKPSNILVGDLGETIVIDWGLAKTIGEAEDARGGPEPIIEPDSLRTRAGIVFGTPGFMAPEQLIGQPADERCDVYALGATLYHLLARKPPHHAATADAMMRAAAAGAPEPIVELAPGVPRELVTIVDKALAYRATDRYQNARELAADLQRFLTGQLVASHRYSRRERLIRFVRKNRFSVGVTVAATLALAIGGWISVGRIVDARDRADAQARIALAAERTAELQREKVTEQNRLLTLTQARSIEASSPTRAVAMVKPLATSSWWRKARAIGAAARARGVAFGLPASPHTLGLELGAAGTLAVAVGDDGAIRLYDLPKRSARVVLTVADGPAQAHLADGDRTLVVAHGHTLTVVDVASGARHDLAAGAPIAAFGVAGPSAFWIDAAHAVWSAPLAGGAPAPLALGEPAASLATSPDGRWIAIAGAAHLLVVDRTRPDHPDVVADGAATALAWAEDSSQVVALLGGDALDVAMGATPTIVHRPMVGDRYAVAYAGGNVYSAGPEGVALVAGDQEPRKLAGDFTLELCAARGATVVTAGTHGAIAVMSDVGDQLLQSPIDRIAHIAASPAAPWLVAAAEGELLVWNLDAVQPRRVGPRYPSGAAFLSSGTLLLASADAAQWIDLASGTATPLDTPPDLRAVIAAPAGDVAVVIDATHHAQLVGPHVASVDLGDDVSHAAYAGAELVLARGDGELVRRDAGGHTTTIAHEPAGALALEANAGWIAAAFPGGTLWRAPASGGAPQTLHAAALAAPDAFALAPDGTVVFAAGPALRAWRPGGAIDTLGTLALPVVRVALVGAGRALAIAADGSAALIDLGAPHAVQPLTNAIPPGASFAEDGGLAVTTTASGALEVIDPASDEKWTIDAVVPGVGPALLAPDGRHVLATSPAGVLVWTLDLPGDPAATASWLAAMTDAVDHGPAAALGWN